jgi:hypothetical protein
MELPPAHSTLYRGLKFQIRFGEEIALRQPGEKLPNYRENRLESRN